MQQMINRICLQVKKRLWVTVRWSQRTGAHNAGIIRGDYDVLISTTIIENSIDIPNANTMIINQAQNFGLSSLHQPAAELDVQIRKGVLLFNCSSNDFNNGRCAGS